MKSTVLPRLKESYTIFMKRIYLDYAAATPVDKRVVSAMQPFFSDVFYNPSALYEGARAAKSALEDARSQTAQLLGARPSEIIFTAGGTESINLAVQGVLRAYPKAEVIVSAIEHEAVLNATEGLNVRKAPVDEKGIIDLKKLEKLIGADTVLVSVMLANNEVGSIQPIKQVSELVEAERVRRKSKGIKLPIYLHTDACQAPLFLDVNVARVGVDLMTLNGGKIHGAKQSGILYIKAGTIIKPMILGGGQEWGYRSGTENVAFAVGFAEALKYAERNRAERSKKMTELRDYFLSELVSHYSAKINGHTQHRLANNIHISFEGVDNERVLFALDDMGIDAAAGSACSASKDTSSHVLLAMGRTDVQARSSLRFTLGVSTTKQEIDIVLSKLSKALKA